jgi:DNA-directed RNA polymerase specialized sigma24 family protein
VPPTFPFALSKRSPKASARRRASLASSWHAVADINAVVVAYVAPTSRLRRAWRQHTKHLPIRRSRSELGMAMIPLRVRKAIVRAVEDKGMTYEEAADFFGVGRATVNRVVNRYRKTPKLEPLPKGGGWRSPIEGKIAELLRRS